MVLNTLPDVLSSCRSGDAGRAEAESRGNCRNRLPNRQYIGWSSQERHPWRYFGGVIEESGYAGLTVSPLPARVVCDLRPLRIEHVGRQNRDLPICGPESKQTPALSAGVPFSLADIQQSKLETQHKCAVGHTRTSGCSGTQEVQTPCSQWRVKSFLQLPSIRKPIREFCGLKRNSESLLVAVLL